MAEPELDYMECGMCGYGFPDPFEPFGSLKVPCPRCGDQETRCLRADFATGTVATGTRANTKVGTRRRRWAIEEWHCEEVSVTTGHRVGRYQVFDRRNDLYNERVVDKETGEELRNVTEPLSEHQGRGTARSKGADESR